MTFGLAKKLVGATLVALIAMASPTQASVTTFYKVSAANGGSVGPAAFLGGANGVAGGFTFGFTSFAFESATSGTLDTATFTILNLSTVTDTITIEITGLGYTMPSSPVFLSSSAAGTSSSATLGQIAVVQSGADANNNAFSLAATPGLQNGATVGSTPPATTYNFGSENEVSTALVGFGTNYSISQFISITLEAGKVANLTLSTSVIPAAVPEPATLAIAFSGIPALGLYLARRRRQKV